MNLFGLSPGELFLIMLVAMIVLGPEKLPETAASVGKWIREFRRATQELTQQFADENPFAEIQRALSLVDEPVAAPSPAAPVETVPDEAAVPLESEIAPVADPAAIVAATPLPMLTPTIKIKSDYFSRPATSAGIQDRWTHSGIADYAERVSRRLGPAVRSPIGEQWTHGVPLPVPVVVPIDVTPYDDVVTTVAEAEPTNGISALLAFEPSPQPFGAGSDPSPVEETISELPLSEDAPTSRPEESVTTGGEESSGVAEVAPPAADANEPVTIEPEPRQPNQPTNGTYVYTPERIEPETVAVGAGSEPAESNEGHSS